VAKKEQDWKTVAYRLVIALSNLMDAVGDMPASADECWPNEWEDAQKAIKLYNKTIKV